jgi:addiction module HigA family antidote
MSPSSFSARRLAHEIDVSSNRITEIIRGRREVSADTASRLSRRFGTTVEFWMNLQDASHLSRAEATTDYSRVKQHA